MRHTVNALHAKAKPPRKNGWQLSTSLKKGPKTFLTLGGGSAGEDGSLIAAEAVLRTGVRSLLHDMHASAKVYRHPNSPYFQAYFLVWDAANERWKPATKSTRCTEKGRALGIARKFEQVALRAAGLDGEGRMTRQFIEDAINSILEISGLPRYVPTCTWDDYSQTWLAIQKPRIGAGSYKTYSSSIASLTKWLGLAKNRPMNAFTGQHLQHWYESQIAEGRKPSSVNNTATTLRAIFDRAKTEGYCAQNPMELILRQHGGSDVRETLSPEDIAQIIEHLTSTQQHDWLTVFLLGLCTGQRLQDCTKADWSQFKISGDTLVWVLTQRKTNAKVAVPIVEPLADHLRQRRQPTNSPLAPSLAGLKSGGSTGLSWQFSRILDAAKIARQKRKRIAGSKGQTWTGKTFHSLRHTTNSLLANAGVGADVRRQILGHASDKMNARYTHLEVATTLAGLKKALGELAKP